VQPTPAVQNAQSLKWKVFPNPAGSLLTIINGTGTEKATRYQVTDIVGSEVTAGTVTGSSQDVNIGGLVPGSYIIQLYNGNHSCGSSLFVKN